MTQLKDIFRRICERSTIKKRCMYLTKAMLKENPNLTIYKAPSFDIRQEILATEVPKLGMEAALKAYFQPPSNTHLDILIGSAIFADGAAALVVGSNPIASINERPLFQIVSASQTFIPESDDMLIGKVREMGIEYYMSRDLPKYIANNIVQCMAEAFTPFGITEWENLFYVVHPGGAAILKGVEEKLGLNKEKLKASWHSNRVLNEMRKMSMLEGKATTDAGLEWGLLFGFGQGLTVETIVLRSIATNTAP
uniref:Chalcone/stilbene synthase C-terminal domain-containing protein n=1 Tax=Gossypium raimondii TaxID=29730 RepID=A0A0D2TR50_GOSRA|nr:hypothetical protein B456_009G252100 [Gossypium raimondii]